jgi:hypothetical protein
MSLRLIDAAGGAAPDFPPAPDCRDGWALIVFLLALRVARAVLLRISNRNTATFAHFVAGPASARWAGRPGLVMALDQPDLLVCMTGTFGISVAKSMLHLLPSFIANPQ